MLAPRDKAAVEGTVGDLTTSIIARLRNDTFLTLCDLNRAIARQLLAFNERPFEKREGSRSSVFQEEEASFLQSLSHLFRLNMRTGKQSPSAWTTTSVSTINTTPCRSSSSANE